MPAIACVPADDPHAATVSRIAGFLSGFSLEATRPGTDEIAALQSDVPKGTAIYLSAVPGQPLTNSIGFARRLRAAGLEPVPHIAARGIASRDMLDGILSSLAEEADVRRVLVIAGDRERPAGPFSGAIDVIESGLLQRHGIQEVGIAGYPEGHPRIAPLVLEQALAAKVEAAEQTGLAVHIVTQFGFDAVAVVTWLTQLRNRGIEHPVRIGMAGPTSLSTLLRYAQRCGVRASVQGLTRHGGLFKHLVGTTAPDGIVRPLADAAAEGRTGQVLAHFYSFGGAAATGRWAEAARTGHIALDHADGFRVEAP